MPSAGRNEKMIELLRHEAAKFLQGETSGASLITVTRVEVSDDGKYATIFFSVLPEDKENAAQDFVKRKRSDFKQHLMKETRLGRIPFLSFELDLGEKNRQLIDRLSNES